MKPSERKVKVPLGHQRYNFVVGTNVELNAARSRYKQLQDGIDKLDESINDDKSKETGGQEKAGGR